MHAVVMVHKMRRAMAVTAAASANGGSAAGAGAGLGALREDEEGKEGEPASEEGKADRKEEGRPANESRAAAADGGDESPTAPAQAAEEEKEDQVQGRRAETDPSQEEEDSAEEGEMRVNRERERPARGVRSKHPSASACRPTFINAYHNLLNQPEQVNHQLIYRLHHTHMFS